MIFYEANQLILEKIDSNKQQKIFFELSLVVDLNEIIYF